MKELDQLAFILSMFSFFVGLLIGYNFGFKSKKFRGNIKGKHNVKLIKK